MTQPAEPRPREPDATAEKRSPDRLSDAVAEAFAGIAGKKPSPDELADREGPSKSSPKIR